MKKRWAAFLTAAVLAAVLFPARSWAVELPVEAQAALLMEKTTGQVLYAKNEHEQLEPASVTKVMTLLLAMEALDEGRIRYDDTVTVSAYAASMGGSRCFCRRASRSRWRICSRRSASRAETTRPSRWPSTSRA